MPVGPVPRIGPIDSLPRKTANLRASMHANMCFYKIPDVSYRTKLGCRWWSATMLPRRTVVVGCSSRAPPAGLCGVQVMPEYGRP